MLLSLYQPAYKVQAAHLLLCIIWNLIGVIQISLGYQSIGPTASLLLIVILVLTWSGMWTSLNRGFQRSYCALSLLAVTSAFFAVYSAVTLTADNWPSEFWRYAGIAVNSVGAAGFILLIRQSFIKTKNRN